MATAVPTEKMDVDTFLAWAEQQVEGRYELVDGLPVAMAPERAAHVRAKFAAAMALHAAVKRAGLTCEVLIDGVGVRAGDMTLYIPDVIVRCGDRIDDDAQEAGDAVLLVEIVSPTSVKMDTTTKLAGYFSIPTLRHFLILVPESGRGIWHCRDEAGNISTKILAGGSLRFDPPGIEIRLDDAFQALDPTAG
jgi:Uma2 family endonuclease